jgi:hypothetical protein
MNSGFDLWPLHFHLGLDEREQPRDQEHYDDLDSLAHHTAGVKLRFWGFPDSRLSGATNSGNALATLQ